MKTVTVTASKEYAVVIGAGLRHFLGQRVADIVQGRSAMIVSDSNVWPIYGQHAVQSLKNAGFSISTFIFQAGEASKNAETYLQLLGCLADNQMTRADCIIALGGGVTGDLAGFAASTYLRGIAYIQVPTTLLAMVDSSVGGKTAIDLPAGKNLVGTFYQPSLVLCDTDMLDTLPDAVFTDGCAEVIKYGILYDELLFSLLEQQGKQFSRDEVIFRCISWKKAAVEQDEFDKGTRQMLNLGHTIGHSIEKASDFSITHGMAVSTGISMVSRSAVKLGICTREDGLRITRLLTQFDLPTSTSLPVEALAQHALSDKKRAADVMTLILPATIGCCQQYPLPIDELESFIKAGM